ncbi:M23 family metallopeptidase, partial [Lacinutrix salivirga]
ISFPKTISGPKTIEIDKVAVYTINTYGANATKADKNNIQWSLYNQDDPKTTYTTINTKSKAGIYTYAKMELVGDKNQLTIVFDKALKGKKVQIEPFRGKPDINNAKDYVRTTTIKEPATPKITIRDKAHLYLKTQCDSIENAGETIDNEFLKGGGFKLETPGLLFPFKVIPQNYPGNYKTKQYKDYDYTVHEKNAATFGYTRGTNRIHAARDLYTDVNESIYAIADGIVKASENFYMDTDVLVIEHYYEHVKGNNIVVRYGEIDKNTIKVKVGDKVTRGQKIAEVGQLIRGNGENFQQPIGENRGMLHIEFYTGEEQEKSFNPGWVKTDEMLHAKSDNFSNGRSFKRRRDLFDPLNVLKKMLTNSQKENLIN